MAGDVSKSSTPTTRPATPKKGQQFVTLKLDPETGRPAWESVTAETRARWREIICLPETAKALELDRVQSLDAAPPVQPAITPLAVASFYDYLSMGQAYLAGFMYKIPAEIAMQFLVYSAEEKKELEAPTQRILEKYGADFLARYADEINLGFILARHATVGVQNIKLNLPTIRKALKDRAESEALAKKQGVDISAGENGKPKPAPTVMQEVAAG